MLESDKHKLTEGRSVVQLNPATVRTPAFAGAMMVVTELKNFGVRGYVQILGNQDGPGGRAFYPAQWDEVEYVGEAVWPEGADTAAPR